MSEEAQNTALTLRARDYQSLLINYGIEQNAIIYLPTGAGKTFIALEIIKYFARDLEKSISEGGKRTLFLVNTNVLAHQQFDCLENALPYKVGLLTGEKNLDNWNQETWGEKFENYQIIVATVQVVVDAVNKNYIRISDMNVVVFDECHHARKNHAMHQLLQKFESVEKSKHPRVIGLSGMLIAGSVKVNEVVSEISKLESSYDARVVSVNNLGDLENVMIYSTHPKEATKRYLNNFDEDLMKIMSHIENKLRGIIEKMSNFTVESYNTQNPKTLRKAQAKPLKDLKNMIVHTIDETKEVGLFGANLSLLSLIIHFELKKRSSPNLQLKKLVMDCITEIEMIRRLLHLKLDLDNLTAERILELSSEKIRILIAKVKEDFLEGDSSNKMQCIIFVKQKYSSKLLYHLFKVYAKYDEEFKVIPDFLVGNTGALPESIEHILNSNFNKQALNKFVRKETNCVIATDVLEEGMDIQSVNLVIMYNYPETYRSYVQSKGRARHETSQYLVFLPESKFVKFMQEYQVYHKIDEQLKKILISKTIDRWEVTEETVAREREYLFEPYVTPKGATLTETSCISWLYRYGDALPNDVFTNANIIFRRIDHNDGSVSVSVKLPYQSRIKHEIESDRFTNVSLAKAHSAFKACIELHESGELDDFFMPVKPEAKIEDYNAEYFPHWQKYIDANDNARKNAGLNKRRIHQMTIPEQLKDCAPQVDKVCYIYKIKVTPNFPVDYETLRVFKNLYETDSSYGILTTKKIPKLCKMKMFQTYGEIDVEIADEPIEIYVKSQMDLRMLENFHVTIFRDVLKVWRQFFAWSGNSYFIVPLRESEINWELVSEFQSLPMPPDNYKSTARPRREDYLYKVITPCYRDPHANYIVTQVHEHKTPLSAFDSDSYDNYKEYFESKYDVQINYLDQFMVEVRGIGKNLNILFPGSGTAGKSRRAEKVYPQEILIPEICCNYKFPGDYWLKATLLPATLHRLYYMLMAENLRIYLLENVGIGDPEVPQVYELDTDYNNYDDRMTADKIENEQNESDCGRLDNTLQRFEIFKSNYAEHMQRRTELLKIFPDIDLPVPMDIDRHWLELSQVDIDNYADYLQEQEKYRANYTLQKEPKAGTSGVLKICDKNRKRVEILHVSGTTPQQKDLIKVLTAKKAHDVFDMERLEVLGDAYLKFIVSLFLFKTFEDWHEGYLTTLKGKIVSNRNLFYCANDLGLPGMIKFTNFQPESDWLPPSISVPEKVLDLFDNEKYLLRILYILRLSDDEFKTGALQEETKEFLMNEIIKEKEDYKYCIGDSRHFDDVEPSNLIYIGEQFMRDKVVADCMEALIGCCVQSSGMTETLKLLKHFKILPTEKNLDNLLDEKISPRLNKEASQEEIVRLLVDYKKFEVILGYSFTDRAYLLQALSHPSYPLNNITECYQQLEFLGDAVLDWLVTSYIFENCPDLDPGRLTDLRSALVNNITLGSIVVKHGMHKYILSENYHLTSRINSFAKYQSQNNHEITDQIELLVSDDNNEAIMTSCIEVPKVLGDIFESLIGAVYLDSGNDLQKTWNVIYNLMEYEIAKFMADTPKQIVRRLFEADKADPKFYEAVKIGNRTIVPLTFRVKGLDGVQYAFGIGDNTKSARKAASKLALRRIQENLQI